MPRRALGAGDDDDDVESVSRASTLISGVPGLDDELDERANGSELLDERMVVCGKLFGALLLPPLLLAATFDALPVRVELVMPPAGDDDRGEVGGDITESEESASRGVEPLPPRRQPPRIFLPLRPAPPCCFASFCAALISRAVSLSATGGDNSQSRVSKSPACAR